MERFQKIHATRIMVILFSFFVFNSSTTVNAAIPAVIVDNTAAEDNWSVIANLFTFATCDKSSVEFGICNGISFRVDRGALQVIQNDENGTLRNFVGVKNTDSTSTKSNGLPKKLNLFPTDGTTDLFPLKKYREAADELSLVTTSLRNNTYGTISFERFIYNIKQNRAMYGIVRVKIPLTNSGGSYKFCGETDCAVTTTSAGITTTETICGPINNESLDSAKIICGHTIPANSKITVYGSLMLDFVDYSTGSPIDYIDLGSPSDNWYYIALPININPANPSHDDSYMQSIKNIRDILDPVTCSDADSVCSYDVAVSPPIPYTLGSQNLVSNESKDEYFYKTRKTLTETEFNSLPDDEKFNLLLPSGYEKGWADAFHKLGISSSSWNLNYKFKVSPYGSTATISEADIRSELFEDIPALISTGGVLSINYHTNISGLIYVPGMLELAQTTKATIPALQYFNGSLVIRGGFYINADSDDESVTLISNNPDNYARIELDPASPAYGKFTRFPEHSTPSKVLSELVGGSKYTIDANGNLPAPDIFSAVVNPANTPGRQWTEIKPQ